MTATAHTMICVFANLTGTLRNENELEKNAVVVVAIATDVSKLFLCLTEIALRFTT